MSQKMDSLWRRKVLIKSKQKKIHDGKCNSRKDFKLEAFAIYRERTRLVLFFCIIFFPPFFSFFLLVLVCANPLNFSIVGTRHHNPERCRRHQCAEYPIIRDFCCKDFERNVNLGSAHIKKNFECWTQAMKKTFIALFLLWFLSCSISLEEEKEYIGFIKILRYTL